MAQAQPRRVLYLIDGLGMGGAERLLVPILQYMDRTHFDVRVCTLQTKDGNPLAEDIRKLGVRVDFLPVHHLRDLSNLPRVVAYLKQEKIDLLHTQLEFANVLGGLAAAWLRIPVVTTLHNLYDPLWGARSLWRHWVMWGVLRYFFQRVIAVSEPTRLHHIDMGKLPPRKVITLYNGIDLSPYRALDGSERGAVRAALSIPPDAPLLLTVAVLRPQKGIQYLIQAMPTILRAVPEARYLIVGGGDHDAILRDVAEQAGVADRVVFAGTRRDIPAVMSACDAFVLPTMGEALPTVLAEAMAASRPIIASAVGGVPEMIEDGINGVLLPPAEPDALAEACIRLLQDPLYARRLGEAGKRVVEEKFSIQQQVAQLGELYETLIAERAKR
ncbi:MAG: glycosyltransferase family 4 protein [Anaerolineae bacterium]|nr:glycosyltransferase family 4 protein [Anaerolineae bacterium]